jgi:hypothetical protein
VLPRQNIDTGRYCVGINNPPFLAALKFLPNPNMTDLDEERFPDLSSKGSLEEYLCSFSIESYVVLACAELITTLAQLQR